MSDQNLMDPSLFIGLSKAHNYMLSWTTYSNEGEKSGPGDSFVWASIENHNNHTTMKPIRAKRKFDEEENTFNGRALKLTKVGFGLLKVQSQPNLPHQPILKEISRRPRIDKKKRLKELDKE